jgi:putative ABC transport system ATP-binding protein
VSNVPVDDGDILRTEGLSRAVGGKMLVDGITVGVRRGDVLAVVGPSGAGKSSFLRLLNRLDEPSAGTVYLDDRDYRTIPPRELRRRVGMVMQAPFLFPGTVADNVVFGPRQWGESPTDKMVEEWLSRVGLSGYAGRNVATLSGGEAQRVSLARTLANSPDLLLLDEPTSALDDAAKAGIEALIRSILADGRLTCIMVTHDMAQASRMANRVMVLEGGRAVKIGTVEEVIHAHSDLH